MSIFRNINNILVQENTSSTDINIENIHTDIDHEKYSFITESYSFVLGYTKEYNTVVKEFYNNILESQNDQEIITEAFGDFFSKAKQIIKKFIAFIKKIFAKFVSKMHSIFKSEKYLKKNKSEFSKFNDQDEFTFKGYEFTHLYESNYPPGNAVTAWFNDDLKSSDFKSYNGSNEDNIIEKITKKYDDLTDKLDDWYDEFRGQMIGEKDYPISSSEYDVELKKIFRNGYTETTEITIDSTAVMNAYQEFEGYDNLIKSIEKTKKEIEENYSKLEKALEVCSKKEKTGDGIFFKFDLSSITNTNTYASTNMKNFNSKDIKYNEQDPSNNVKITNLIYNKIEMYMKAKVTQVHQMSSIHTMAFSAKLQAAKDNFVQNKSILYKALSKIKGHKEVTV
jgi:hypothetical protein